MDDDEIDADTYEELTAKVVQCREDLQKFLAMRLKKKSGLAAFRDQYLPGFDPVEIAIGGSDGLAMKYTMASCDKNGDQKPDKCNHYYCFRHALDWKKYEVSSDSELEEEIIFKDLAITTED